MLAHHACGENLAASLAGLVDGGSPPRVWGKPASSPRWCLRSRFTPTREGKTCPRKEKVNRHPVHPHACGENVSAHGTEISAFGSPPRVWGKPSNPTLLTTTDRFTPTRVGKTGAFFSAPCTPAVHPHACGENTGFCRDARPLPGSPPRVWGKRGRRDAAGDIDRFTPTRVGKTRARTVKAQPYPVHPHACGENQRRRLVNCQPGGSPPRVWGKRTAAPRRPPAARFTPTRVGKTPAGAAPASSSPVHPHACGENRYSDSQVIGACGSPPRVWGKLQVREVFRRDDRFTPTRVGKTLLAARASKCFSVHSHACGENAHSGLSAAAWHGSPPRVWGKLDGSMMISRCLRFTPTRVGKTPVGVTEAGAVAVHPHACGENSAVYRDQVQIIGSPPRVWGKHARRVFDPVAARFTPTRVGKTSTVTVSPVFPAVHPHACGENHRQPHGLRADGGSPPRVWGKRAGCGL